MKRILFPLFTLFMLLQSCQDPAKKKVYGFNQKLAVISLAIHSKGENLGLELKTAMNTHDFSKTTAICRELKSFIDDKISEVNATENVSGSENLKKAMLDFLKFEKQMIAEGFDPFGQMNKETPDEEIRSAVQAMVQKTGEENNWLAKVQEAQREYAARNGLKLKE